MDRAHPIAKLAIAGLAALAVVSCSSRIATRGNLPDPDRLADIKPGEVSRNEVEEILGSPSSVGLFQGETWYYISERTETTAFFRPEVTERQVVIVHFDDKGVVESIEKRGLDAGRDIEMVKRKTPTAGHEMTLFQQLFGNIGRFSKGEDKQAP